MHKTTQTLLSIFLSINFGCIPSSIVPVKRMAVIQPGDSFQRVAAVANSWPRDLFIEKNSDGAVQRCVIYYVAAPGRVHLALIYRFHNGHLISVGRAPDWTGFSFVPTQQRICIRSYEAQSALIAQISSSDPISPGIQSKLAEELPVPRDDHGLGAMVLASDIFGWVILFPELAAINVAISTEHDHWNPERLPLGSSETDADQAFGKPFQEETDSAGRTLRLYWDGNNASGYGALPLVVIFDRGKAIRIVSQSLAVTSDYE